MAYEYVSCVMKKEIGEANAANANAAGKTNEDEDVSSELIEELIPVEEEVATVDAPSTNDSIRSIKRRGANPENWKQTVRKQLRQSGKEYVNSSGKLMNKRQVRPGCGSTCHHRCGERFTEEQRKFIHQVFWNLSDEHKNFFYWKYTSRVAPKRHRGKAQTRRANTFLYRFEVLGELLPVCSKFFLATLDITSRRIYYFYEHCYQEDTCMPGELSRGKNNKPTLPNLGVRLDAIRQHIGSFPSVRLAGSTQKRYLDANLNLTRMYKMYAESAEQPLKQHWYCKVFNEEFHLGFRLPKINKKGEATVARKRVPKKVITSNNNQHANEAKQESIKLEEIVLVQPQPVYVTAVVPVPAEAPGDPSTNLNELEPVGWCYATI